MTRRDLSGFVPHPDCNYLLPIYSFLPSFLLMSSFLPSFLDSVLHHVLGFFLPSFRPSFFPSHPLLPPSFLPSLPFLPCFLPCVSFLPSCTFFPFLPCLIPSFLPSPISNPMHLSVLVCMCVRACMYMCMCVYMCVCVHLYISSKTMKIPHLWGVVHCCCYKYNGTSDSCSRKVEKLSNPVLGGTFGPQPDYCT